MFGISVLRRRTGFVAVAGVVLLVAVAGAGLAASPVRQVSAGAGPVCGVAGDCTPVVAAAAGMAVPLVQPWLRGTDGGWTQDTACCAQTNTKQLATVSGLFGTRAATVVPFVSTLYGMVNAAASSTLVSTGADGAYRLIRVKAGVNRAADDPASPATTSYSWAVSSDVFSYNCRQRGVTRDPLRDCGTGTQAYTRGHLSTPHTDWTAAFTVVIPITYGSRTVDAYGRPLTTPRTATGHWTLTATPSYHGWLWTTEWNVNSVASGRVAGSAFIRGDKEIVITDGPFH